MGTEMRGRHKGRRRWWGWSRLREWCVHRHGGGALLGELEGKPEPPPPPGYGVHRSPRKWELRHGRTETAEGF